MVADGDVGVATVFHLPLKLPGLKVVVIETQTDGGPGPVGVWGPGVDWSRATVCAEEWSEDLPSYERIGDFKVKGKVSSDAFYYHGNHEIGGEKEKGVVNKTRVGFI